MPKLYFSDGTANALQKKLYYSDGTAWAKQKELYASDGTAWSKIFSGEIKWTYETEVEGDIGWGNIICNEEYSSIFHVYEDKCITGTVYYYFTDLVPLIAGNTFHVHLKTYGDDEGGKSFFKIYLNGSLFYTSDYYIHKIKGYLEYDLYIPLSEDINLETLKIIVHGNATANGLYNMYIQCYIPYNEGFLLNSTGSSN